MVRCMICDEDKAHFMIKETTDYYCKECAEEQFADLSYLVKIEEQAKHFKKLVDKKTGGNLDSGESSQDSNDES